MIPFFHEIEINNRNKDYEIRFDKQNYDFLLCHLFFLFFYKSHPILHYRDLELDIQYVIHNIHHYHFHIPELLDLLEVQYDKFLLLWEQNVHKKYVRFKKNKNYDFWYTYGLESASLWLYGIGFTSSFKRIKTISKCSYKLFPLKVLISNMIVSFFFVQLHIQFVKFIIVGRVRTQIIYIELMLW